MVSLDDMQINCMSMEMKKNHAVDVIIKLKKSRLLAEEHTYVQNARGYTNERS